MTGEIYSVNSELAVDIGGLYLHCKSGRSGSLRLQLLFEILFIESVLFHFVVQGFSCQS